MQFGKRVCVCIRNLAYIHCVSKMPTFVIYDCSYQKCWQISITFGTHYTQSQCNIAIIYLPTSFQCCCYTTLGNIGCSLGLTGQSYTWMHKNCPIFVTRKVRMHEPYFRSIAGDAYIFQQDSAPAHYARQMIKLLQRQSPKFIAPDLWPPNSQISLFQCQPYSGKGTLIGSQKILVSVAVALRYCRLSSESSAKGNYSVHTDLRFSVQCVSKIWPH